MRPSSISTPTWIVLGGICAGLIYVPMLLFPNAGIWNPVPFYALILLAIVEVGILYLLPVLFSLQFLILHKRHNFLRIQVIFLATLWALTPFYFWNTWEGGLRYMGEFHTRTVFAVHVSGLVLLSCLAWAAFLKRSSSLNNLLNILLFCFFFWGAFPILGETP